MALGRARAGANRRENQRGAASQRLLLALGASALLTAAVSLPMAYQAHEARAADEARRDEANAVEVLGTTTIRPPDAVTDTLYWRDGAGEARLLHLAQVPAAPRIVLRTPNVVRADFRLNDGPVETDRTEPFELRDGAAVPLEPGDHSVTVTVTDANGRSSLHQAFFTSGG